MGCFSSKFPTSNTVVPTVNTDSLRYQEISMQEINVLERTHAEDEWKVVVSKKPIAFEIPIDDIITKPKPALIFPSLDDISSTNAVFTNASLTNVTDNIPQRPKKAHQNPHSNLGIRGASSHQRKKLDSNQLRARLAEKDAQIATNKQRELEKLAQKKLAHRKHAALVLERKMRAENENIFSDDFAIIESKGKRVAAGFKSVFDDVDSAIGSSRGGSAEAAKAI